MEQQLLINNHKEYRMKYMRDYRQRKKEEKEQQVSTTEIKISEKIYYEESLQTPLVCILAI